MGFVCRSGFGGRSQECHYKGDKVCCDKGDCPPGTDEGDGSDANSQQNSDSNNQASGSEQCEKDTGASCRFSDCDASHGVLDKEVKCEGNMITGKKCMCMEGYCNQNGKCALEKMPDTCSEKGMMPCGTGFGGKSETCDFQGKDICCKPENGACPPGTEKDGSSSGSPQSPSDKQSPSDNSPAGGNSPSS